MKNTKIRPLPVEKSRWWDDVDLGLVLLLLVIPITAYGCEKASGVASHRQAYEKCAAAKDLTDACRVVLQQPSR